MKPILKASNKVFCKDQLIPSMIIIKTTITISILVLFIITGDNIYYLSSATLNPCVL